MTLWMITPSVSVDRYVILTVVLFYDDDRYSFGLHLPSHVPLQDPSQQEVARL